MRQGLVKVFTGQRRVGKSYLLYQLMQQLLAADATANIIYINKEDMAFDAIQEADQLYKHVSDRLQADGYNYIFIDEIQEIKDFEKAVRSLLLRPQNDIYITGSNAQLLSGELATLLSGRTIEIEVHSLSYPEFLQFHSLQDEPAALDRYLRYGGLPYLSNLTLTDEVIFDYLKNIYTSILYRDVVARYHIRSLHFLEKLVQFLADSVGSMFSAKSISDYLKAQKTNISHNQVQAFVGYLANAFLIHSVPRYDIKGKRLFETGEKYYFENLGVRNAIIGYRSADLGKLAENAVYNHLRYKGYDVKLGWLDALEVDFVANKDNETMYVQVALRLDDEKTVTREFGNLQKIPDNYRKLVVTLDPPSKNTYAGIEHTGLRQFLLE